MIPSIRLFLLSFSAVILTLSGCSSEPTILEVKAKQQLCDSGFDSWNQPTCSAAMKDAGTIQFTLYPVENRATAKQNVENSFAQRLFVEQLNNCTIQDAKNWSCEIGEQYFFKVKNGHYHHYTLNEDLTLSHFIGTVTEVNKD
ncbi:MAG: hypothetical protein U9R28_03520 [Pseudomonadota bacterium]|nr:hypothetical protein [Pseudomonadota bacterium]